MARRRKIGLGEVAIIASAVAEASKGKYLSNTLTSNIRTSFMNRIPLPDGIGQAAGGLVLYEFLRKEANKAGVNPRVGPFRVF